MQPDKNSQLRLLLPSQWLNDLTLLAKAHSVSRLALLRWYIRDRMKDDLQRLKRDIDEWHSLRGSLKIIDRQFPEYQTGRILRK